MGVYTLLVNWYNTLLQGFPVGVRWLITLVVLIAFVYAFIQLISTNVWFVVLLIVLLPAVLPIFVNFLNDVFNFLLFLLTEIGLFKPAS